MAELYIDGGWVSAQTGARREIRCPADGTLVAEVDEAGAADTEAAIAAARRAFDDGPWPHTTAAERGDLLLRVATLLQRDRAELARMESLDTGKRLAESEYDIDDVTSVFRFYGELVAAGEQPRSVETGQDGIESSIVHEPVGVCGLISPWNYPLLQVSWKVAPCLAAGNTFVLKPSELTPHTAIHLMRLLEEAGLPAGVGNLVLGAGADAGAPLATDPRVDLVSFTGGLVTGKRIMVAAAETVKKVALELGGKNPLDRLRGRRPRARRRPRADGGLPPLRPGLLGRRPPARRGVGARRDRRRGRRARRADPPRRPLRRRRRDRRADLRAAPRQGREVRRRRRRRGRRAARGWRGAPPTASSPTAGSTRRPCSTAAAPTCAACRTSRSAPCSPSRPSATRTTPYAWPTTRSTASPAASSPPTPPRPSASPPGCGWARCGSTTTTPTCRRPSGAATSSPASVASSGSAGLEEYRETKHLWHNTKAEPQGWFD